MKFAKLLVPVAAIALLFASCGGQTTTADGKWTSKAVAADEKAMAAEKAPNFASPTVEDKALKVSATGLEEGLIWMTSKPGVFGSNRAKQGGTFHMYTAEFPETLRTVGPNANGYLVSQIRYSPGLVETNYETKDWMPGLATHWAFGKDKKTVYYKLNEKAKWTDGKPVTSKDFVFGLKMMRSENIQDPWYNEYYTTQVADVKAYGDYVVAVVAGNEMEKDDLLMSASITPRPTHFYGDEIGKDFVEKYQWLAQPVTGPYALTDFVKGESITFTKVKDWWGHAYDYNKYRFNVDTVEIKVITGGNDIVKNYFFNGELDQYTMIIPQEWADGAEQENIKKGYIDRQYHFYVPLQGLYGIFLNTQAGVLTDLNVRQGLYYAIDMQGMIDKALRGEYARYHNIGLAHVFGGISFNDETIRKPGFDPKKAGELFDKAGYTKTDKDGIRMNDKGVRLSFELIYGSPNHTERLSVLKEEAKKAGLNIDLKLTQQGAFTALREKKYQAYWGGMSTSFYPDYWEYFHSKNANITQTNNFFGYGSPEMDKLLDAARAESSLAKKAEFTKQIERLVDKEALIIPNYFVPYYRGATWKWVRFPGWLNMKFNDDFYSPMDDQVGYCGYFWIDSEIQKEVKDAMAAGNTYEPRTFKVETYKSK